jgi:hypothetical protein
VDALRSRGPTGPDPKLSDAQLAKIEDALLAGAMANGFDTDLWTLERVAVVITQLTAVRYHPGHVWVILRRRLGWTLQRPERRGQRTRRGGHRPLGSAGVAEDQKGARAASAWLDSQRDWLTAERLPAYAPELNPVEYLWANLKDLELANLATTTLAEVADATEQGIQRVRKHEDLVVGFLAHTGLPLDP